MQPNDKSLDINDKIIEILVEILERCGVWNNHGRDDPTSWNQVSKSLDQLSSNVEKLATMQIKSDRVIEILLAIEQDIQDVRAQSKLILQEQQDISEVLSLCRELERIGGRAENHRMLPLSLSLSSFVRNQRLDVMDTLKQVDQYLSTLYEALAPEKSSKLDLVQRLRVIAKDLDQRCIQPNSPPWSDAKEFVKVLLSRRSRCDPRLTLDKPEQDSRIHTEEHTPSETTGSSSSYSTPASSNGLVRFETVIEMALAFANQNMAPSIANRCILLVGSEGSGKSFCLDQIQKQTPKTVNGKHLYFRC